MGDSVFPTRGGAALHGGVPEISVVLG